MISLNISMQVRRDAGKDPGLVGEGEIEAAQALGALDMKIPRIGRELPKRRSTAVNRHKFTF